MTLASTLGATRTEEGFHHEALFYAGLADFVHRISSFIRDSLSHDEPILVVVSAAKIELLRAALGRDDPRLTFADMAQVGLNPARIIPAWQDFVAKHGQSGHRFRGIGEPIWAERSLEELVECERHEALLNLAFAGTPAWWLVCPYDTASLGAAVLEEAHRNHPSVLAGRSRRISGLYRDLTEVAKPFDRPLPEPPGQPEQLAFGPGGLTDVRRFVSGFADGRGLSSPRTHDLVLAVNEVITNSVRYGGGHGVLRIWMSSRAVVCEVRDEGRIDDPLVGRRAPTSLPENGRGLWLVNKLCELVQVRSFDDGSVVRLHMSID